MTNYKVCISVKKDTYDILKKLGVKGETFDDIIKKLLKHKGVL